MQFCSDAVKQIALRSFAHRFGNGDQTSSAGRITHYRYPVNLLETKNLVDLLNGAGIERLYRRLFDEHHHKGVNDGHI